MNGSSALKVYPTLIQRLVHFLRKLITPSDGKYLSGVEMNCAWILEQSSNHAYNLGLKWLW